MGTHIRAAWSAENKSLRLWGYNSTSTLPGRGGNLCSKRGTADPTGTARIGSCADAPGSGSCNRFSDAHDQLIEIYRHALIISAVVILSPALSKQGKFLTEPFDAGPIESRHCPGRNESCL